MQSPEPVSALVRIEPELPEIPFLLPVVPAVAARVPSKTGGGPRGIEVSSLDLQKSQQKFLEQVAHDAQNPLAAILCYAEMLGNRLRSLPLEAKYTGHIRSAAQMLSRLISDLVDLAAIETGKLRVTIKPVDLAAIIGVVCARIRQSAREKRIRVSKRLPRRLPPLSGDPLRLEQVIQNLCANAVQYTPAGGSIRVSVEARPAWVVVNVRDTGMGIAPEELPRVFERFYQGAAARKSRREGLGLGLEICREIVSLHGGCIDVESRVGEGSRFYFTLPIRGPDR